MAMSFPRCAMLRPQSLVTNKPLQSVSEMVKSVGIPSILTPPHLSLQRGNWVKLICGASFEDVVDVRNLSLVYTLAGVDCIDCAADASVVCAVNEGIEAAINIIPVRRPWTMISINDNEDIHFRKAEFDPEDCPLDCLRPCVKVCPANAISMEESASIEKLSNGLHKSHVFQRGVITERCYGCGRCSPVCPYEKIGMVAHLRDAASTSELLKRDDVDAIEIHTSARGNLNVFTIAPMSLIPLKLEEPSYSTCENQYRPQLLLILLMNIAADACRQTDSFEQLWNALGDSVNDLRLVAISLPDIGDSVTSVMNTMFEIMRPNLHSYNLWQLDGRPMSGDTGRGATRKAISFAVHLSATKDKPPGFLQLAGGTNAHTVHGLIKEGIFQTSFESHGRTSPVISGVAFGGYARKIVGRILSSVESEQGIVSIENHPEYLKEAVREALHLVGTVKSYNSYLN
ncbi:hypothetical protein V2J09_005719 [Rumex salicifolius]